MQMLVEMTEHVISCEEGISASSISAFQKSACRILKETRPGMATLLTVTHFFSLLFYLSSIPVFQSDLPLASLIFMSLLYK